MNLLTPGRKVHDDKCQLIYIKQEPKVCSVISRFSESDGRLTDVHNVAFPINHDIAIVPVLDLQYIAGYRVRGH